MNNPKFDLNLSENNSIGFSISIEGNSAELGANKPEFRFVLSERNSKKAWLYPMEKDNEGDVVVQIPPEEFFSEGKEYEGQVEVILGSHYFVPTTVDIEFVRPLKVEAMVKNKNIVEKSTNKPTMVNVSSAKVKQNPAVKRKLPENKKTKPASAKRQWADLTKEEQEKLKKIIIEKKRREAQAGNRSSLRNEKRKNAGETNIKDHLKMLMADSLADDI